MDTIPTTREGTSQFTIVAGVLIAAAFAVAIPLGLRVCHFIGISDDDASRTLIAWNFSQLPSIDPTASSWLPLPTYVLGTVMRIVQPSLFIARCVSLTGALLAFFAAIVLGKRLGATGRWALFGGIAAMCFPWSIFTAWAPGVPEMLCAALTVAAVATITVQAVDDLSWVRVMTAGLLLALACGCRYESWFVSVGVVAAALRSWESRRSRAVVLALTIASLPVAWMALNFHRSGHAFEFVSRVIQYHAEHAGSASLGTRLTRYPWMLVTHVGAMVAIAVGAGSRGLARASIAWGGIAGLLVMLMLTDVLGGGPTHHAARALIPAVWILAPIAATALGDAWASERRRWLVVIVAVLSIAQASIAVGEVPREVDEQTVRAGNEIARRANGRYFVEAGRLDFMWLELVSGRPQDAVADRNYGSSAPSAYGLLARASGCTIAAVHTVGSAQLLTQAGWTQRFRAGPWQILEAPSPTQ